MSFYGSSFSFNGVSCEEFGLMLYDFNNTTQGNSTFVKTKIEEDRVPYRARSLFYGTDYEDGLEFKLVFGANDYSAAKGVDIDRQEMEAVSLWLTGHNEYKWLVIDQPDMMGVRYHCIITDLEMLEVGFSKWGFSCTVHCDSPFAYTMPHEYEYIVVNKLDDELISLSSARIPYVPKLEITLENGGTFSITNHNDSDREFILKDVPPSTGTIYLDGENGVLRCDEGLNLYKYCNFKWPRLVGGDNNLSFVGNGRVKFLCEFPVNYGG